MQDDPSDHVECHMWNVLNAKRNTKCPTCQRIMESVELNVDWDLDKDYDDFEAFLSNRGGDMKITIPKRISSYYPLLISIPVGIVDQDHANYLEAFFIDLSMVKAWISDCDQGHARSCHTFDNSWETIKSTVILTLIDTEKGCLVEMTENCRYLALSYVWGGNESPFQTVKSNIEHLLQPGAFHLASNRAKIPKTILDSLELTSALGLRYLWVDRFCIIQDDDSKHRQLTAMASVYVNAYFTIVAVGDANIGLTGLYPERPREGPYQRFDFSPSCTIYELNPRKFVRYNKARYFTRGWTFQEWNLSRRRLIFHDDTATWICQKRMRDETGVHHSHEVFESETIMPTETFSRIWTPWPNLESYLDIVVRYTERDLSYADDALNAFEAFITVYGRTMYGGILHGVPELFFSNVLLWTPRPLTKRRTDGDGNVMKQFPSWSWAGWQGEVEFKLSKRSIHHLNEHKRNQFTISEHISVYKRAINPLTGDSSTERRLIKDLH